MTLPLYSDANQSVGSSAPPNAHLGLWYDKFCNTWLKNRHQPWTLKAPTKQDGGPAKPANPKLDWINTAARITGDKNQIEAHINRIVTLVQARQGDFHYFQTEARLVTGTGRSHPTEIGFTWHPTLAVPYLPGSSVKGLLHAWAVAEANDAERVMRLFGTPSRAGCLCFLDALPTEPVRLEADVMTPHYGNWTLEDPPGDWRSPTPIPFLTTAANTPFLFAWLPRAGLEAGDHDLIADWLKQALVWAGAGAKTAVGYGRMVCQPNKKEAADEHFLKAKREREKKRLRDAMDPFDRELSELTNDFGDGWDLLLYQHLKKGRWPEDSEEELRVLKKLRAHWQTQNRWKQGQPAPAAGKGKKKAKKAKKVKKTDKQTSRVDFVRERLKEHGIVDG